MSVLRQWLNFRTILTIGTALLFFLSLSAYTKATAPKLLETVLSHYELVHKSSLRHISIPNDHLTQSTSPLRSRQVHFYSLGRSFSLHLFPHRHLFSPNFTAVLVNGKGESQHVRIDTERFHIGHLIGDSNSTVIAHINEEGLLTAHIKAFNDTYYIEPASLHLNGSHDSHMIMYKLSDVDSKSFPFNKIDYETVPVSSIVKEANDESHTVLKRQSSNTADTCSMIFVVDFRAYSTLLSSENIAIITMSNRLLAVNRLSFRPTHWIIDANGNTKTGLGIGIGRIIIHTEPNSDPSHYNSIEAGTLGIQNLLRRFSRGDWSSYCLAHLITVRQFPTGQLGLAYIASPSLDETGGICSQRVIDAGSGEVVVYNTGVSVAGTESRLLLPHEAELVIAHEIGHSWGSPHDPGDEINCRLRYIMNEFAQDDTAATHREFSPCSRASIGRVLNNKAICFSVMSTSSCGNYEVDSGEECDGGRPTVDDLDPCCDTSCHLRPGKICSDNNHRCCQDCTVAPAGSKICHFVNNISINCTVQTPCNGISFSCPSPLFAPEGSNCLNGICKYVDSTNTTVQCVPYCSIEGYVKCKCTGSQRCLECCLNVTGDGTCQPLLTDAGEHIFFPDGSFCDTGVCLQGTCVDQTKDFVSQLWSVITTLNINEFTLFLRTNIVIVILTVSLLVWIPGSCLFHYLCDVKKVWKKFIPHYSDTDKSGPAFVAQSSWIQCKTGQSLPLIPVDEDEIIDSKFFQPIEEPEDDLPLPLGYHDYSGPVATVT